MRQPRSHLRNRNFPYVVPTRFLTPCRASVDMFHIPCNYVRCFDPLAVSRLHRTAIWDDRQAEASAPSARAQHFLPFPSNCIAKSKHSVGARIAPTFTRTRLLAASRRAFAILLFSHLSPFRFSHSSLSPLSSISRSYSAQDWWETLPLRLIESQSAAIVVTARFRAVDARVRENPMKNDRVRSCTGPAYSRAHSRKRPRRVICDPRQLINPVSISIHRFSSFFASSYVFHNYLSVK